MRPMRLFRPLRPWASALVCAALATLAAVTGSAAAQPKSTADGIAEYRRMLEDGNPAELFEAKGEALWATARGPRQASLQACDLGLGPGVVKGAWVQLPRWFADTGRVQDLESRLLSCMQTLQGFNAAEIASTRFDQGEQATLAALAAWISGQSKGRRMAVPQAHSEERRVYELGKRAFFFRGGPMDFSCASCHGEAGKRIRLQDLPQLTGNPGDGTGFTAWPAYRVSSGEMWSLQRRLNDCFRQQRFPYPGFASDVTVALGVYMGVNARGAESIAPALKR